MSEEKPRLSRREMREQGLLKVGREDTPVSRDDLLTRTSELQLRRPSRREMRLQREANEAKAAEQSAKLASSPTQTDEGGAPEEKSSRAVHTFSFPALNTSAQDAQDTPAPSASASAATATPETEAAKGVEDTAAPAAQESPATEPSKEAASSGRSSVFDRFHAKDKKGTESFRDRLVARTREGQLEDRESQPVPAAESLDVPDEQVDDAPTQLVESIADKPETSSDVQVEDSAVEESPAANDVVNEVPVAEETPAPEESAQADTASVEDEPEPKIAEEAVEEVSGEGIVDDEVPADTKVDDKADDKADNDESADSSADSAKDSNAVAAVAEDGRYPTDVTMRLTSDDDDEDGSKTVVNRLFYALIVLLAILIGLGIGLIVQKLLFRAEGIDMQFVYSIQAIASGYGIGI